MRTFSSQGSPEFNEHTGKKLDALAGEIEAGCSGRFRALILGGGYGRGEGACVIREGRESLYNDLDLFIVLTGPSSLPDGSAKAAEKYEQLLGIEVDIGKPLTGESIRSLPHELMWQDLITGHMVLSGDPEILTGSAPAYLFDPLPAVEALRLMLNRGSGLLQAVLAASGAIGDADKDFIRRNLQKCHLAFGDTLLITHGSYQSAVKGRPELLEEVIASRAIPRGGQVLELYRQAAAFKLNPDSLPPEQPEIQQLTDSASLWNELLLYQESVRTGKSWKDIDSYCRDPFVREPRQHKGMQQLARNALRQARLGRASMRYPREMLYRMLPRLLDQIRTDDPRWIGETRRFLSVWRQVN